MAAIDILRVALYGEPPNVNYTPDKAGVLSAFEELVKSLNTVIGGTAADATAIYAARATLYADLAHADKTLGLVYNDADATLNGIYIKSGASGAGSWVFTGLLARGPSPTDAQVLAVIKSLDVYIASTAFEYDISAAQAYLAAITKNIEIFNGKSQDLYVSLLGTAANRFRMHISSVQQADQVAYFDFDPVADYTNLGRIPLIGNDPLGGDYTAMVGYVEIYPDKIVQSGSVIQPTTFAEAGIRRANVHTRFSVRDKHPGEAFQEVIVYGPGETYTTLAAAAESLYDAPLADPMGIAVIPTCARANALYRPLLLAGPGTYTPQNVHLPDFVCMGAQFEGSAIFEHPLGATLPMVQAHLNHDLWGLVFRTTVQAEYAVHFDYAHLYQSADTEGDFNREFYLRLRRCQMIVGAGMNYQPFGSGIPLNAVVDFEEVEFLSESAVFTAPFAAAHNTDTPGGGRFRFTRCSDKSGRANIGTVLLQTTYTNTYKSVVEINDCPTFNAITAHEQIAAAGNSWKGVGNFEGTVYADQATIPGELLEFSAVMSLRNTSGASIAAGKAVVRNGDAITGLTQDGSPVDAVAFVAVADGAFGRFFVARQIDARMLTISDPAPVGSPAWLYVANGVLTTTAQASGVKVGRLSGGVVRLL